MFNTCFLFGEPFGASFFAFWVHQFSPGLCTNRRADGFPGVRVSPDESIDLEEQCGQIRRDVMMKDIKGDLKYVSILGSL